MTLPFPTPRPDNDDTRAADRTARAAQDADLIALISAGDGDAYESLYRCYAPRVRTVVRRVLAGGADVEDVVQVTFLAVWQSADHYDPRRGAVSTWIYTLAHHKAVDAVRHEDQHRRRRAAQDHLEQTVVLDAGPDELVVLADQRASVRAALNRLDSKHADTLNLAYFGDRSLQQVAADMGVPEGTAKSRSRTGLRQLRTLLVGVG
ncbi:MAG: sigma-70 family RNA polymerase sigma factor [Mycobacteriales bacterium]